METTDPRNPKSDEAQPAARGDELNIGQVQGTQIESQDSHWLRMDPSLTSAVLAKTEEELLGSLAALMRNKVEHEQASRRFAQTRLDTEQAKRELETIKAQIRRAEEEVAIRLSEQSRINEEIVRVRQELVVLREGHQQHTELVSSLKNEAEQTRLSLAEAHRDLGSVRETAEIQLAAHRETITQLAQVKNEQATLGETLAPLRKEVEERIRAREALIAEAVTLDRVLADLASDKERMHAGLADLQQEVEGTAMDHQRLQQTIAEGQTQIGDLSARKASLEQVVAETAERQKVLQKEVETLESRLRELAERAEAAEKAEQARIAEGLPLLFDAESQKIAPEWDSYPLESEFHTDEVLDARKVAELVSLLPGLEGCLILKNRGSVLASRIPERIHSHLKVPNRDYQLLFERLEKKVEEFNLQDAHLATFDLGEEALTVAQANHAFVFVNHKQTKLRPGMPGKLASIASEVSKMYPEC
jgi:regulator of replication initiation timing